MAINRKYEELKAEAIAASKNKVDIMDRWIDVITLDSEWNEERVRLPYRLVREWKQKNIMHRRPWQEWSGIDLHHINRMKKRLALERGEVVTF